MDLPLLELSDFRLLLSEKEIESKIAEVGSKLTAFYKAREITLLVILKGAIFFATHLMNYLPETTLLEAIFCESYGKRGKKAGPLTIWGLDRIDIEGKDLLILDDIFDTGATLSSVVFEMKKRGAKSVQSVVLLSKKIEREVNYYPDNVLFEIEDCYVVGFGLDYKGKYRGLRDIFCYKGNSK